MLRYFAILPLLLFTNLVFGQSKADTTYVAEYPQRVMLTGFLTQNSIQLARDEKEYMPNNPLKVGAGIAIKNTVINLSYNFGLAPLADKRQGDTKAVDIQLHQYGRYFVLDLFYQKYKGFYSDNNDDVQLFPDMSVRNIGAEFAYVFKGDKFSTKAAFQQSEIQLKSAGSFILGGGAYLFRINPGGELWENDPNHLDNLQFGVNAGYAYTWVINERWLLTGILTAGVNVGNDPDMLRDWKLEVYPTALGRWSGVYHKNDWAVAATVLVNNKTLYPDGEGDLNFTGINFQMSFVKHIDF